MAISGSVSHAGSAAEGAVCRGDLTGDGAHEQMTPFGCRFCRQISEHGKSFIDEKPFENCFWGWGWRGEVAVRRAREAYAPFTPGASLVLPRALPGAPHTQGAAPDAGPVWHPRHGPHAIDQESSCTFCRMHS